MPKKRRLRKIIGVLLGSILLMVACTLVSGYAYLRHSLPTTEGAVAIAGLSGEQVRITRDADAVPHIYAETRQDAMVGLGYVHAQDRLWQMELQRRVSHGRLAEILGGDGVEVDRFIRTLGAHRAAAEAWTTLSPEARGLVEAYVAGINGFLADRSGADLPAEFTVLRYTPEPWQPLDVIVWIKMMGLDLAGNYEAELLRADTIRTLGGARAQELFPDYPLDGPSIMGLAEDSGQDYAQIMARSERVRAFLGTGDSGRGGIGSNSWVVDAAKSTTGAPLLANDPHLGTTAPSLWYFAHLSVGGFDVAGASVPGLPGVIVGRNTAISWGISNLNADVQDLYRERLDPDRQQVEFKGEFVPLQIITETIKVKDAPDIQHIVRVTPHGPLISDQINAEYAYLPIDQRPPPLEPLALRWTALDRDDRSIEALLAINMATDWHQFTDALSGYVSPALNFVYADREGNIGYYAAGRIPIRQGANRALPLEGWSGANDWEGTVPFSELPHRLNPDSHMIVTANNRPAHDSGAHYLGVEWDAPYRARRIQDLLEARVKLSPDDFAAIQNDTFSLYAQELVPLLLELVEPRTPEERRALDLLRAWDGDLTRDSAAAALYKVWADRLPSALLRDELGPQLAYSYQKYFTFVSRFLLATLARPDSPWCDNTQTPETEDCRIIARRAFEQALADLSQRMGADMDGWTWGAIHNAEFYHQPFDEVDVLRPFFSRSIASSGDESTVNVGGFRFDSYSQRTGAGYRQIFDMASLDNGRFIIAIGQSGNILSPHYDDFMQDWRDGRYRSIRFSAESVQAAPQETLRLTR